MSYYVTFYSFKGGVGRTLTLVNTAVSMALRGRSVFIWELDLEAPSILDIPLFKPLQAEVKGGTVNLLAAPQEGDLGEAVSRFVLEHREFEPGRLRLLPAGPVDGSYAGLFASIRWEGLFGEHQPAGSVLFERLRRAIDSYNADFVLIDSRTGLTDVGAVCTVQLPDALVLVYSLGHQSLERTREIQFALSHSSRLHKIRRRELTILRVATMVPGDIPELVAERRGALQDGGALARAARRKRHLQESFNLVPHVEIPFNSSLLLEERIWTMDFPDDPLSKAYESLARRLEAGADAAKPAPHVEPLAIRVADDLQRRGNTFEDKVAEVLRLMGYEVEQNVLAGGSQVDIITSKREPLHLARFLVECKDHARPAGVEDARQLRARLDAHPDTRGLLVSRAGFTAEAQAYAKSAPVTLATYDELLATLIDLGDYLSALIQDYEGKDIERLYVEQDVWPETAEEPLPLLAFIDSWLANPDASHLTLLGDYGTGKTWFTRKLACALAKRYREDPLRHRQPIRIDLREVAKALSLENLLYDHFTRQAGRQVNPKSILYLLAEGRLVLILDGFDEMATQANWEVTLGNFRELARAAERQAKIILTSRTHYFKDQAQVCELLEGRSPQLTPEGTELYKEIFGRKGFSVAYLRDFTPAQLREYLGRACGDRAAEVAGTIERIAGLRDIAARPVLLEMIVKSAPRLVSLGREVKIANLYEAYTEEWLQRQDWRLSLTKEGRTTLVQELAARLWETDGARIHYRALADVLTGLLKDRITTDRDLEMADYEVRTASFLTRDAGGNYGFSHRSFLEFFLAQRTARLLKEAGPDQAKASVALRLRSFSPQVIGFLRDLCPAKTLAQVVALVLETPYSRLGSENSLLLYASLGEEAVQPVRIELEGAELAGLSLASLRLARANLRKACLAGSDLSGADLQQACLAEADLREARLDRATCHGTDFSGANLGGTTLTETDLDGADLSGVDLSFATLVKADVRDAKWDGALIDGAGLYGAQVTPEQLTTARKPRWAPGGITAQPCALVQPGVMGFVACVAYSRDGKLLAADSGAGSIAVLDTATGRCRRMLSGHAGAVTSVAWSPGGRQLVSGSDDKTIRLWDVDTGGLLRTFEGHQGGVRTVAYCPDGRWLASGSHDKTIRLWDVKTGRLLRTLEGHQEGVWAVAWHPEEGQLASGSGDHTVRLWDVESGLLLRSLEGHQSLVSSLAYHREGRQLASGSNDHTVRVWEVETGRLLHTLEGHRNRVWAVAYRPDGWQLASGSDDRAIRLWDVESGRLLCMLEAHQDPVMTVAYHPEGRQLASGSLDRTIRLWDVESGRLLRTLEGQRDRVWTLACNPAGRQLASGSIDRNVGVWDVEAGRLLGTLEGHRGVVFALAYHPDGRQLASGSDDNTVRIWDSESGRLLRTLQGHEDRVMTVAWQPDGRQLASGSGDQTIRLWDVQSGRLLRSLEGRQGVVWTVAYHPEGRQLASGSGDDNVRLWDTESGRLLRSLEGHQNVVSSLAYHPEGRQLASGSFDESVRLWGVESGRLLHTLQGHEGRVWTVAYHPEGRQLASASVDKTVRLWDVETGRLLRTLEGHVAPVRCVVWVSAGRKLASSGWDGTIRIWDVESGRCLVALYQFMKGGWLAVTPDNRYTGNAAGKRWLTFVDNWALYSPDTFPELEDPEAVRTALSGR
ncbi:MAG: restriction endonuclease [Acidobacteriota bacterium]